MTWWEILVVRAGGAAINWVLGRVNDGRHATTTLQPRRVIIRDHRGAVVAGERRPDYVDPGQPPRPDA